MIDDVDTFDDPMLGAVLDRLTGYDSLRVVGALESRSMSGYSASAMVGLLRRARRQLILQPDDPSEFLQTTGVKLAIRPGLRMPPGRGVLLTDRTPTIIQLAVVSDTTPNSAIAPRPARQSAVPGRPVATPRAAAPSVSTRETEADDLQPART